MLETVIYERLEDECGYLLGDSGGAFSHDFSDAFDNGDPVTSRIYPVFPTENTALPFAVYTVDNTQTVWTLQGPIGSYQYGFTIEVYSLNMPNCVEIAQAVRAAFDGFHNQTVQYCQLQNASSSAISATGGAEAYMYTLTFAALGAI